MLELSDHKFLKMIHMLRVLMDKIDRKCKQRWKFLERNKKKC